MGSSQLYSVHPALAFEAGSRRRRQWRERSNRSICKKHWKISMKRSASTRSSKRPISGVKRRIRILKKLVPNGKSNGLEALFAKVTDYIKCLQMKVHIMQVMVKLLSPSD